MTVNTPASRRASIRAVAMLQAGGNADPGDLFTTLADALCDLRHWADANDINYGDADNAAYRHYYAEAIEPDDLSQVEL